LKESEIMSAKNKPLTGTRIGILGKGGSGKSTVTLLLAKALQNHGYDVCVLDADSTNLGLHQGLGIDKCPLPLIDYFGGMVFSGGLVTCPVDDPFPLQGADISFGDLPGEYYVRHSGGILFLAAGKIADQGPGAGCDGPVAKIARDLRIRGFGENPVTLVDFKAGFEDSARGAITSLDWSIVVVDPTNAAIQMASDMVNMVHQMKAGALPATEHLESPELVEIANMLFRESNIKDVLFVLNRVHDQEMEDFVRSKLRERDITPIGAIREDPLIAMAWLKGTPLEGTEAIKEAERIVEQLLMDEHDQAEVALRARELMVEGYH
jgi:CO dehydrogenase maturation factor